MSGVDFEMVDRPTKSSCCNCCKQGGCCTYKMPPRNLFLDDGITIKRVNLEVRNCICCASGLDRSGLDVSDTERVPPELLKSGMSITDWQYYVRGLADAQNWRNFDGVSICKIVFKSILFPFFLYSMCKNGKKDILARDAMLREWQIVVNKKFKELDSGFFIKTRSNCFITYNDKGQRQRHVEAWIAIATTEAEAEVLMNEPHLSGTIDNTEVCGGVDESQLCWHH
jgi:hypothetical protein